MPTVYHSTSNPSTLPSKRTLAKAKYSQAETDGIWAAYNSWEKKTKDTVDFKKIYVDMAGDLVAGIMLSQLLFWFQPNREGSKKTRYYRTSNKHDIVIKTRAEWWDECRLSAKQVDRATAILVKRGIIEDFTTQRRTGRSKAYHLNYPGFYRAWLQLITDAEYDAVIDSLASKEDDDDDPFEK